MEPLLSNHLLNQVQDDKSFQAIIESIDIIPRIELIYCYHQIKNDSTKWPFGRQFYLNLIREKLYPSDKQYSQYGELN